jgi:hypothetical protein
VPVGLALSKEGSYGPFGSPFAECAGRHSAKGASLSSAMTITLGKETLLVPRCSFFAECYVHGTRLKYLFAECNTQQSDKKTLFINLFLLLHSNKQKIYH